MKKISYIHMYKLLNIPMLSITIAQKKLRMLFMNMTFTNFVPIRKCILIMITLDLKYMHKLSSINDSKRHS